MEKENSGWPAYKIRDQHTEELLKRPPILTQEEKLARIYEGAKRLNVKIGGIK